MMQSICILAHHICNPERIQGTKRGSNSYQAVPNRLVPEHSAVVLHCAITRESIEICTECLAHLHQLRDSLVRQSRPQFLIHGGVCKVCTCQEFSKPMKTFISASLVESFVRPNASGASCCGLYANNPWAIAKLQNIPKMGKGGPHPRVGNPLSLSMMYPPCKYLAIGLITTTVNDSDTTIRARAGVAWHNKFRCLGLN